MKVAGDRSSSEGHRAHNKCCRDKKSEHWAVSVRFSPDHSDDDKNRANHRTGDAESATGRPLGDDPPGAADHEGHTDQPHHQKAQVANREDHHRQDEEHCAH